MNITDYIFENETPRHFEIITNIQTNGPELVVNHNNKKEKIMLDATPLVKAIALELPAILNESNIKYASREYNRVRIKLSKILHDQLKDLDKPTKEITKTEALESVAGIFYKNGKWAHFKIAKLKAGDGHLGIRFCRRGNGLVIRNINTLGFDYAFDKVFEIACKRIGLNPVGDSTGLMKSLLKNHLREQHIRALVTY